MLTILLIEDSTEDAELISGMLDVLGDNCLIRRAVSLSSGMRILEEQSFDVVILDVGLPDGVGLDSLVQIRNQASELPIIVLTGLSDEALAAKAISMGAQDYLVKGKVDSDSLHRAIRYAIERQRLEAERKRLTDAVPALLGYIDANYHYRFVNQTYESWFGLKQERIVGRHVRELLGEVLWDRVHLYMERAMGGEKVSYEQELPGPLHNHSALRWVQSSLTPDFDDKGKIRGFVVLVQDISERKLAEEALRESEEKFSKSFHGAPIMMAISDIKDGTYIDVNNTFLEWGGFRREEVIGKTSIEIGWIRQDDRNRLIKELKDNGRIASADLTLFAKDGRPIYCINQGEIITIQGRPRLLSIAIDISERKKASEALMESEVRYRRLFEVESDAILLMDAETGQVLEANEAALVLYGYNKEEFLALGNMDLSAEPDKTKQLLAEQQRIVPICWHRKKDGTVFPVEMALSYFQYQGQNMQVAAIRDISERKQIEEKLRKISYQNELLLKSTDEGICGIDKYGLITFINPAGAKLLGYEPNELVGKSLHGSAHYAKIDGSPYPEEDCPSHQTLTSGTTSFMLDDIYWRKDGSSFYVAASCSPVSEDSGIVGAVVTFRDVTEHQKTLKALEESEIKYREIFEQSKDAIVVSTPEGIILDINAAGVQLFGYDSRKELLNKDIARNVYVSQQDRAAFRTVLEHRGFVNDYELQLKKKNGERLIVLYTSTLSNNDKGEVIFQSIIRDVTEQRKVQQQLQQAQKMEAVGQLAGGIAHDFNNILSAITGYGYLIKTKLHSEDPLRADVEEILASANRAAEVTHSLLAFSRKQRINPMPININESIERVTKLLSRLIGEDIEVVTQLAHEDIICTADAAQIEQVLINLATNARDSMPRGGRFVLKTETAQLDDNFIKRHGFGIPGAYVLISATDTGIGMDQNAQSKIFEPFYTTKETGKGTGLGLAMVYGIIKQHEGYILVNSELGKGSTFCIYLPIGKIAEAIVKPQHEANMSDGTETILVAEDDNKLRELYEKILSQRGYKVILAQDGDDAIRQFKENKDEIQLVVLDMIMPRKSGKETYDEIKEISPDMRFIFLSGYTADRLDKVPLNSANISLITKPVSPRDLFQKLRELLDN